MKRVFSLSEIDEVARDLVHALNGKNCMAFYADMGSGKTTLIAAICRALDVIDHVSSPTFSIINEYRNNQDQKIYHMDWYRLKNTEDAIQAGVQDVLDDPDSYKFIEWPEMAEELLPQHYISILITLAEEGKRKLTMIHHEKESS